MAAPKRPYHKLTPAQHQRLREWYRAKLDIGTHKTIAKELGISPGRVEQLVTLLRAEWGIEVGQEK